MTFRSSAFIAAGAVLAGYTVQPATAGTYLNTIDDSARLHADGNAIAIGGPIGCPDGLLVKVRVLVSQDDKAVGDGTFAAACTGDQERWSTIVDAWGAPAEAGDANARAWATTWDADGEVKSWSWAKPVVLKEAADVAKDQ